jgi:hypothetical protein
MSGLPGSIEGTLWQSLNQISHVAQFGGDTLLKRPAQPVEFATVRPAGVQRSELYHGNGVRRYWRRPDCVTRPAAASVAAIHIIYKLNDIVD